MWESPTQYEDLNNTPGEQAVGFKSVGSMPPGSEQL